jgi:cytochrome P450
MATVATPLPVMVMAELLGVPPTDHAQFKQWSDQRARALEPTITARERQVAVQAARAFDAYFRKVIDTQRALPGETLLHRLLAAEEAGDTLAPHELLVMLRLLLMAGNETTTNLIGNGMLALLRHPEQLQALQEQPQRLPAAIEELLRYDTPVQVDFRTILDPVEFAGRLFQRGQGVLLMLGAANRDPDVFPRPDHLDMTRTAASHLAFGRGIHYCLGAALARLEGRIVFETLFERFGDLRLLTAEPPFKDHMVLRGLTTLPLSARPRSPAGTARLTDRRHGRSGNDS